tara:strand:- start:773 stop:1381 length:609 start_codon:yes stop_codon:yes gene_type:complete
MMNEENSQSNTNRSTTPVAYKINSGDIEQGTVVHVARPVNAPPPPPTTPITATAAAAGRVTNRTILAYNLAKSVKLFSVIDGIFCFFYALYSVWYFIPLIMNIIGYYGAKKYNKRMVLSYLIYSILNIISKSITWVLITFYLPISDNFDWNGYTFFFMVGIIIELYICHMVHRLYKTLQSLNEEEFTGLNGLKYREARIIYW